MSTLLAEWDNCLTMKFPSPKVPVMVGIPCSSERMKLLFPPDLRVYLFLMKALRLMRFEVREGTKREFLSWRIA